MLQNFESVTLPSNFMPILMVSILIGAGLALYGVYAHWMASRSQSWPTTPGRVILSEVETRYRTKGRRSHTAHIVYEYEVDGVRYECDRINFGGKTRHSLHHFAEQQAFRYPTQMDVLVAYNPDNPSQAVLECKANWNSKMMVVSGGVSILVAIAFMVLGSTGSLFNLLFQLVPGFPVK